MGILKSISDIFKSDNTIPEARNINFQSFGSDQSVVSNETAITFTAVWAAMRLLSESVSSLPISVYKREKNGDNVEMSTDPLTFLLKYKPNGYQNKITFLEQIMMDLLSDGNSYVRIVRNRAARPVELVPLNRDSVKIYQQDNKLVYEVGDSGDSFDSDDILHFKLITGGDGITGLSPISQCKESIGWGLDLENFSRTFFKNGAKISGVLESDKNLSESAINRLRSSWNNNYSGLSKSNQTAVLEDGIKFKNISLSPDQAQFLASRQFSIQEIARIFNVPPHKIADLSKSSFSNIESQNQDFLTFSLMPYLSKIELEMNTKLFRKNEIGTRYVKFNVNGLLRGDVKSRAEYYNTMLNIGAMSINEIRNKEDMNAISDGDNHFMQLNMTTINKIGDTE